MMYVSRIQTKYKKNSIYVTTAELTTVLDKYQNSGIH